MNTPTLYHCQSCRSTAMSPTGDSVLMKHDKETGKNVIQNCTCGGKFTPSGNLFVFKLLQPVDKLKIHCNPCKKYYRKVSPSRVVCPSCNDVGFVRGVELWFKPNADISIS